MPGLCLVIASAPGGRGRPRRGKKQAAYRGESKPCEAKTSSLPMQKQAMRVKASKDFLFLAFLIGDIISLYMPGFAQALGEITRHCPDKTGSRTLIIFKYTLFQYYNPEILHYSYYN